MFHYYRPMMLKSCIYVSSFLDKSSDGLRVFMEMGTAVLQPAGASASTDLWRYSIIFIIIIILLSL